MSSSPSDAFFGMNVFMASSSIASLSPGTPSAGSAVDFSSPSHPYTSFPNQSLNTTQPVLHAMPMPGLHGGGPAAAKVAKPEPNVPRTWRNWAPYILSLSEAEIQELTIAELAPVQYTDCLTPEDRARVNTANRRMQQERQRQRRQRNNASAARTRARKAAELDAAKEKAASLEKEVEGYRRRIEDLLAERDRLTKEVADLKNNRQPLEQPGLAVNLPEQPGPGFSPPDAADAAAGRHDAGGAVVDLGPDDSLQIRFHAQQQPAASSSAALGGALPDAWMMGEARRHDDYDEFGIYSLNIDGPVGDVRYP